MINTNLFATAFALTPETVFNELETHNIRFLYDIESETFLYATPAHPYRLEPNNLYASTQDGRTLFIYRWTDLGEQDQKLISNIHATLIRQGRKKIDYVIFENSRACPVHYVVQQ